MNPIEEGDAAFAVDKGVAERNAEATGYRGDEVDVGGDIGGRQSVGDGHVPSEIGPADLALDAEHQLADLPVEARLRAAKKPVLARAEHRSGRNAGHGSRQR